MSVKMQFAALGEALASDLRDLSPYNMAAIAGYGRVGGYAPDYAELRRDVFEYFDVCRSALDSADFAGAYDLPPLVRNRTMVERFFLEERDTLLSALRNLMRAAGAASETRLSAQLSVAEPMVKDQFTYLLRRAGVKIEPAGARSPAGARNKAAAPEAVYVASRLPAELGEQISDRLLDSGFEPIGPGAEQRGGRVELDIVRASAQLARASGGVFGVRARAAAPSRALTARLTTASEAPRRAAHRAAREMQRPAPLGGLIELSLAERRIAPQMMIVATPGASVDAPARLERKPALAVKHDAMDASELQRFDALASETLRTRR